MHPVVGAIARDDDRALEGAHHLPVVPHQLDGGVHAVTAAAGQEDLRVRHGRQSRDAIGEIKGGSRGEIAEGRVPGDRRHLTGDRVRDLRAPVTDVAVPQRCRGIEVAATLLIGHTRALTRGQNEVVASDD